MASFSYSDIGTVVTPAGTITFNAASGDTLRIVPRRSTGLGTSQVRAVVRDKAQTDGYILLPFFLEGQHLALAGDVVIRSAITEAGIVAARDTLLTDTLTKCKSILQANGTLNFVSGGSLAVRCEILPKPEGGFQKVFLIGFVSGTPA